VLKIECLHDLSHPDKKGQFTSTGNLKNVLQESLMIGRLNAFNYLTEEERKLASEMNIHIHFTEGA